MSMFPHFIRRTAGLARPPCRLGASSLSSSCLLSSPRLASQYRAALHRQPATFAASFSSSRRGEASPTAGPASSADPAEAQAQVLVEQGSVALEAGDVEGARDLYQRSLEVKETATGHYNLGIALYQLKSFPSAISHWRRSVELAPSADAHTNLASAYILATPPEPRLALQELEKAVRLAPDDAEIRFNLGAVAEANGQLEESLQEYTKAKEMGIARAEQNIRNVGAKLLRKKVKEEEEQAGKEAADAKGAGKAP